MLLLLKAYQIRRAIIHSVISLFRWWVVPKIVNGLQNTAIGLLIGDVSFVERTVNKLADCVDKLNWKERNEREKKNHKIGCIFEKYI
mmetsp:Transcript_17149/g.19112  ORF Transcript_17149/g.19112 Transcript_17149/m.19112 type:complete len:87 (+) Transcript_17149:1494-1754(+)